MPEDSAGLLLAEDAEETFESLIALSTNMNPASKAGQQLAAINMMEP